jgi:hypothetical protein
MLLRSSRPTTTHFLRRYRRLFLTTLCCVHALLQALRQCIYLDKDCSAVNDQCNVGECSLVSGLCEKTPTNESECMTNAYVSLSIMNMSSCDMCSQECSRSRPG